MSRQMEVVEQAAARPMVGLLPGLDPAQRLAADLREAGILQEVDGLLAHLAAGDRPSPAAQREAMQRLVLASEDLLALAEHLAAGGPRAALYRQAREDLELLPGGSGDWGTCRE